MEASWRSRNSCYPDMLEFCSVGELSSWGCELEIECQIAYPSFTGKVRNSWKSKLILGKFWHASSTHCPNLYLFIFFLHAGGRAESALLLSFLCKVLRHKDYLPFPREKIDSGVLWHNFGIFTHTEVQVFSFFFFFFFFE